MGSHIDVREVAGAVDVRLCPRLPDELVKKVSMVIDIGADGRPIGVEILNLVAQVGDQALGKLGRVLPNQSDGLPGYSYDSSCDAFYLRLASGRSAGQVPVLGDLFVNPVGHVVALLARFDRG